MQGRWFESFQGDLVQSTKHIQTMLLDDREELQRGAARPLGASFPFLDGRLARVQIASKYGLAHVISLA